MFNIVALGIAFVFNLGVQYGIFYMFRNKQKDDTKAIWSSIKVLQENDKSQDSLKTDLIGIKADVKNISSRLDFQDRLLDKQEKINDSNWKNVLEKLDSLDKRFSSLFENYELKRKE